MNAITTTEPQDQQMPIDPMILMIERIASAPDLPIERLTALMDMRERQMAKEAEQVFNQAFAAAVAEMPDAPKDGHNKHSGQKYTTLDNLIRTTRLILAHHGLSLNRQTTIDGSQLSMTAIVRQVMGRSISTTLSGARDSGKQMNALQAGRSTEAYLKRYTGFSLIELSCGDEIDDDGQGKPEDGTVTPERYIILRDLIEGAGTDEAKIHLAYGNPSNNLHQFPSSMFLAAELMLNRKKATM